MVVALCKALQRLLQALLAAGRVYVLTANPVLHRVEAALNGYLDEHTASLSKELQGAKDEAAKHASEKERQAAKLPSKVQLLL